MKGTFAYLGAGEARSHHDLEGHAHHGLAGDVYSP